MLSGSVTAAVTVDAATIPPEVAAGLANAKVPEDALSLVVQTAGDPARSLLEWRADKAANPASLMKLVTTYAALDLLGTAWAWSTPVWLSGSLRNPGPDGVLEGDLVIKGSGDPKLVLERSWLLLQRVRLAGVRQVRGDIVLDRSAFRAAEQSPADFDGEPLRPYNVQPEALMLNFKSVLLSFVPDPARGVAIVTAQPALAGTRVDATVPLGAGACESWRVALKLDVGDAARIGFKGSFPSSCAEKTWPLAFVDPRSYNARLIGKLWQEVGGTLTGEVRDGLAPRTPPSFEFASPPLAEIVRDINKFSNNLMAEQLFLTLGLQGRGAGTPEAGREVLGAWLHDTLGERGSEIVVDNGSGLSRSSRATAAALALLLQRAWASPVMPEFVSSLPVSGVDGTLRRLAPSRAAETPARAHLKTGSLRDVAAVAGYVLAPGGARYVVVAIVNHPNANAARPALDALVEWVASARGSAALRR